MAAIASTAIFLSANSATAASVNLSVSRPKENVTKSGDGKFKSGNRRGTSTATEIKKSIFEYAGKASCNPPKDTTVSVTVEAYFITRSLAKGSKDEISERKEIAKFEFGGENPSQQTFSLLSPPIEQTTVTTRKSSGRRRHGGGSSSLDKDKSGTRLMGVIIRALVDGKPVKVISEPSNMRWIAAGKKDTVELE